MSHEPRRKRPERSSQDPGDPVFLNPVFLLTLLLAKVTQREVMTGILLLIPAVATTMLTYFGTAVPLEEQGGGIVSKGQALAFAITIGIFSWLGWFYGFGILYRLSGIRLRAALTAGIIYLAMIVAIDSPFNMIALAGGSAVQMSISDTAVYYETRAKETAMASGQARQLLPAIKGQETRFEGLGKGEERFGTFSGSPGPGKVSAAFFQIRDLLAALSREIEAGLAASETLQKEITTGLAAIKTETYTTGPLRPRVRRVSIEADRLDDALGRLERYDYAVSIEATLASLRTIFPAPNTARTEFEAVQNDQMAVIAAMAVPVAESLQEALTSLRGEASTELEPSRPEHAVTAIRTYWKPLIFQWTAAIFIDIAPACLLIILTAAFREVDHSRAALQPRRGDDQSQSPEPSQSTEKED